MRKIKLTKGYYAILDDDDFTRLGQFKWSALEAKNGVIYAVRYDRDEFVFLHREVMGTRDPSVMIDHRNRNGLNCTRRNLRFCTNSLNSANRIKSRCPASSFFKGVSWDKINRKWRADIQVNYKRLNLGRFCSEKEAARAYNAAAKKYFGEFASVNLGVL